MFEIDNNVYQLTEKKKDTMVAKHDEKLKTLRNVHAIRSESSGKEKNKKYQSRSMKVMLRVVVAGAKDKFIRAVLRKLLISPVMKYFCTKSFSFLYWL